MISKVKILIIRFSSIGDIVLTTPVIRCLQQQLADEVELHFLTKNQYKSILTSNPRIAKVYGIEKSTNEIIEDLKLEQYDYIIDLHKNLRSKRVIRKLKVLSFTFDKLNYQKWLLTTFKINKLPKIHIVERYLNAVKPLGVENDGLGLEYYIPENDVVDLKTLPLTHQNGYVSFAIGAQHNTKRLPLEKMFQLLKQLNLPVVLLGGKEDVAAAEFIQQTVGEKVFNGCGKFNLNQSASLVKQSKVLLTHDTGLMHIGAALGVSIVSVWGNTIPEFGMYPYYPKNSEKFVIIENNELSCRPCSKIGYDKCPKKHFNCMNGLENEWIAKVVLNFYNN
ncbi:MAG: glycosyl transferase [Bacteroidetes bacterium RIFCSPLOWO2_12_FULL_31_6]|nr:MAG: glycosyl transferase [Bacteroidetes bacterium RIFCSPLOWO2_12_FULL_31_6]